MKTEKRSSSSSSSSSSPSPASSSLALSLSLENSPRCRLSFSLIFSSLFLFLLFHQRLLSLPSSPSSFLLPPSASHSALSTRFDFDKTSNEIHVEEEIRTFRPYGSAAALFVVYSAYRGGPDTFAVVGLGSKPLFVYGKPEFECYWLPSTSSSSPSTETHTEEPIKSKHAYVMQPDVGYGRVYTVVVVNCTFEEAVGTSSHQRGGQLVLYASYGDGLGKPAERIVALEEDENSYKAAHYEPPYPYEYMYCGSPLFSNLNAQRIREWIAYHVMKFGPKSHFMFHDAGGMHAGVRAVLEPWKKLGFITIQNVKQTTQYDGYYYNQFLILNDCLHKTKFMANWTFFFDVDEYIYNPPDMPLRSVLDWHVNNTMLVFKQLRMSESVCQYEEPENDTRYLFTFSLEIFPSGKGAPYFVSFPTTVVLNIMIFCIAGTAYLARCLGARHGPSGGPAVSWPQPHLGRWAFEKLVYGEQFNDVKYAVQARRVFATGVHMSQKELGHMEGEVAWAWWPNMRFYHYHNTISRHRKFCDNITHNSSFTVGGRTYDLDTTMVPLAPLVQAFEHSHIGTP